MTAEYFELAVADGDALYRERVYCYELYHQLRCLWEEFPFSLGGEVDKAGHSFFRDGPYARAKPDFLVHCPGQMRQNLAIVEVKRVTVRDGYLRDDFRKLSWFCLHAQYFKGILLVYGNGGDVEHMRMRMRQACKGDNEIDFSNLALLYHRMVGQRPEVVAL